MNEVGRTHIYFCPRQCNHEEQRGQSMKFITQNIAKEDWYLIIRITVFICFGGAGNIIPCLLPVRIAGNVTMCLF
jgi:hypothetical protein